MSAEDDISHSTTTSTSGTVLLFDIKGIRILYGDNDAELPGVLTRLSRCPQLAKYQDIIQDRVYSLGSGRCVCRDTASVICYLERSSIEAYVPRIKYSAANICPESPGRLTRANAAITAKSGTLISLTRTASPADLSIAFVNEHAYDGHDGGLLLALSSIFTDPHTAGTLMEKADGSGLELLSLLAQRRDQATGLDRTVLMSRWQRHVNKGVVAPITYINWTTF